MPHSLLQDYTHYIEARQNDGRIIMRSGEIRDWNPDWCLAKCLEIVAEGVWEELPTHPITQAGRCRALWLEGNKLRRCTQTEHHGDNHTYGTALSLEETMREAAS